MKVLSLSLSLSPSPSLPGRRVGSYLGNGDVTKYACDYREKGKSNAIFKGRDIRTPSIFYHIENTLLSIIR